MLETTAVKAEDFTDDPRTDLLDAPPHVASPSGMQSFERLEHLGPRGGGLGGHPVVV